MIGCSFQLVFVGCIRLSCHDKAFYLVGLGLIERINETKLDRMFFYEISILHNDNHVDSRIVNKREDNYPVSTIEACKFRFGQSDGNAKRERRAEAASMTKDEQEVGSGGNKSRVSFFKRKLSTSTTNKRSDVGKVVIETAPPSSSAGQSQREIDSFISMPNARPHGSHSQSVSSANNMLLLNDTHSHTNASVAAGTTRTTASKRSFRMCHRSSEDRELGTSSSSSKINKSMHRFYVTRLKHSLIISFLLLVPVQNFFLFFISQFSELVRPLLFKYDFFSSDVFHLALGSNSTDTRIVYLHICQRILSSTHVLLATQRVQAKRVSDAVQPDHIHSDHTQSSHTAHTYQEPSSGHHRILHVHLVQYNRHLFHLASAQTLHHSPL